jgi:hypothetical protein
MVRRVFLVALAVGLVTPLLAGGFWEKKSFEQWSQEEVVRMLTRSPWSSVVVVPVGSVTAAAASPLDGPCPCGCGNSPVFEDVFGQGGEIDTEIGKNPRRVVSGTEVLARSGTARSFTVRFMTAKPVRMAMARYAVLAGRLLPEQGLQFVTESGNSEKIIVAVGCLESPPVELDLPGEALQGAAYLQLKASKTRVGFEQFLNPSQTDQGEALFVFPRFEDGVPLVTRKEKEVTFELHLPGTVDLKAKFKLKDMLIDGELEI